MARPRSLKPSYCLDRTHSQAYVRLNGRKHLLGPHGSRKSRDAYDRLVGEWIASGRLPLPAVNARDAGSLLTVTTLINEWLKWAWKEYGATAVPDGRRPKGELGNYWTVLSELRRLFGSTQACKFGPNALRALADEMTRDREVADPLTGLPVQRPGLCRNVINRHLSRVKTIFKWAAEQEPAVVPGETYYRLLAVRGIRARRGQVRETAPVKPVPERDVRVMLPFLTRHVAAMVEVELYSGMRPGELCSMRWGEIDFTRSDGLWIYRPAHHKTEHHGKQRLIVLGPKAQEVLKQFLPAKIDPTAHVFSPATAESERNSKRREDRVTPLTPSHIDRAALAAACVRARPPCERYTVAAYCRAIARACEKAFKMPAELRPQKNETPEQKHDRVARRSAWHVEHGFSPNQLRHTAATEYRRHGGLDAAQLMLGHSSRRMTENYAEPDNSLAERVAKEIG